jgi:hypothetical protein
VRSVGVRRVWDCMLCACVSEEGGYRGEGVGLEAPSLPVDKAGLLFILNHKARAKKNCNQRTFPFFIFFLHAVPGRSDGYSSCPYRSSKAARRDNCKVRARNALNLLLLPHDAEECAGSSMNQRNGGAR